MNKSDINDLLAKTTFTCDFPTVYTPAVHLYNCGINHLKNRRISSYSDIKIKHVTITFETLVLGN